MGTPDSGYREQVLVGVSDCRNAAKATRAHDNGVDVMSETHGTRTDEVQAAGVNGCPGGWVAVSERSGGVAEFAFDESFERLVRDLRDRGASAIAVGTPIGLPEDPELRRCDREARDMLGGQKSSVFPVPSRDLLEAETYDDLQKIVAKKKVSNPNAKSISIQAFSLGQQIKQVDAFVLQNPDCHSWLLEVHNEVSFRSMAGEVLPRKKTPDGGSKREDLVRRQLKNAGLPKDLLSPGQAQPVHVLDALAALWTAQRFRDGDSFVLGGDLDAHGVPMRIVV